MTSRKVLVIATVLAAFIAVVSPQAQHDEATLRLVGDCTNICVLYTAADARNLGYAVEVVRDGVTSFDAEAHHDALRELERTLGAKIV